MPAQGDIGPRQGLHRSRGRLQRRSLVRKCQRRILRRSRRWSLRSTVCQLRHRCPVHVVQARVKASL